MPLVVQPSPGLPALATTVDLEDVWRPLTSADDGARISRLLAKASAALRQQAPFDVDARIGLFGSQPPSVAALDPQVVATVVATVVKRYLVNPEGVASESDGVGPFSHTASYVNRYDKTGSDVRGAIEVTDADIDQLRIPTGFPLPASFSLTGQPLTGLCEPEDLDSYPAPSWPL